ncbi:MAG TPA: DNA-3-methyladenine glycosylase [Thermoanaerobaculia bacterium]|nr:DNA-3-methyladenine glycosylase [Thermoanaerobaculia bacterium]
MRRRPLPRSFYRQETVTVARALLGCVLQRRLGGEQITARIVETEAYLGANDPASHARRGLRSRRNESMYLPGGHAYVYFTYGMHFCLNVVTGEEDVAEAVLLRAAQPLSGLEAIRRNRPRIRREHDLMSGPGRLCLALGIDRELDGISLRSEELSIAARDVEIAEDDVAVTPRVGIDRSGEAARWPLRFFLAGNRYVSMPRSWRGAPAIEAERAPDA